MKNEAASTIRMPALFTIRGYSPRNGESTIGRMWPKSDTTTMWMARVNLKNGTFAYATSRSKDALVQWVRASTPAKGLQTVIARRTYNDPWDKVVARREERNFTATAAKV